MAERLTITINADATITDDIEKKASPGDTIIWENHSSCKGKIIFHPFEKNSQDYWHVPKKKDDDTPGRTGVRTVGPLKIFWYIIYWDKCPKGDSPEDLNPCIIVNGPGTKKRKKK